MECLFLFNQPTTDHLGGFYSKADFIDPFWFGTLTPLQPFKSLATKGFPGWPCFDNWSSSPPKEGGRQRLYFLFASHNQRTERDPQKIGTTFCSWRRRQKFQCNRKLKNPFYITIVGIFAYAFWKNGVSIRFEATKKSTARPPKMWLWPFVN